MTDQRRYVVTGSSTGMGAAFVERVRAAGGTVIGLDVADPAVPVDEFIRTDLSDPASIDAAVDRIAALDVLVNCAGVPDTRLPADKVFAINYLGLRKLTLDLHERITDGGDVLHISSQAGNRYRENESLHRDLAATGSFAEGAAWFAGGAAAGVSTYRLTKEAVWWFTFTGARLGFARGVRSNSVAPGIVSTALEDDFMSQMSEVSMNRIRSTGGRTGQPDEIAGIMQAMLAPQMRWMNGHNLLADGGFLADSAVTTAAVVR